MIRAWGRAIGWLHVSILVFAGTLATWRADEAHTALREAAGTWALVRR